MCTVNTIIKDSGRIAELGRPEELLGNTNGLFYSMVLFITMKFRQVYFAFVKATAIQTNENTVLWVYLLINLSVGVP